MKPKKPLPRNAVLALIVAGGLLVAAAGWMLAVKPEQKKAAALNAQTASVQQQIQSNLAQIAAAKDVRAAPKIDIAPVYKLAEAMPASVDTPDLLLQLDEVGKEAGVGLTIQPPGAPQPSADGTYSTVTDSLTASGSFYSVTDLLYRLQNLVSVRNGALDATGRLYSITSLSLAPAGARKVDASIDLLTYVYGVPSSSSSTTAATPAPTDTTATTATTTTAATTTTTTTTAPAPSDATAAGAP